MIFLIKAIWVESKEWNWAKKGRREKKQDGDMSIESQKEMQRLEEQWWKTKV